MKTATLGYRSFGDQIREISKRIGAKTEDVAKNITVHLFNRIVLKSPVDTGRFRANWNFSAGSPDLSVSDATAAEGKSEEIASQVNANPLGAVLYLSNGLPYAGILEFGGYPNPPKYGSRKRGESGVAVHVINGFSMQAPHGMVRVSFGEVD